MARFSMNIQRASCELLPTSIPLRLNPIMHTLHLNMKLSKSVVGTFSLRVLERWIRSAFLASLSGLCMRCMCSRSLSFLLMSQEKNGHTSTPVNNDPSLISIHLTLNCLPHVEQRKSLRSEWRSMCKRSLSGRQKAFSQSGHWKIFSEWKQRICFFI